MKAWVFDLDGTLVDSSSFYIEALSDVFRSHGVPFGDNEFRLGLVTPVQELLTKFIGMESSERVAGELQIRFNRDAARIQMFDGIAECLENLREGGARVAVWTARELESAEIILRATGLDQLVEAWVSGTCVENSKPHPEGLKTLLSRFTCDASDAVMIGDHEHDMMAASDAGTRAIRAAWSPHWGVHSSGRCLRAHEQFESVALMSKWICTQRLPKNL